MVDTGDEGKKYGFINQKGEWIIEPSEHASLNYSEGLVFHSIGNPYLNPRYGYMDQNGEYVIKPKYKDVSNFSEGLACVTTWGKSGYINTKGQWIWKPTR